MKWSVFFILCCFSISVCAQDLNARIKVVSPQVQSSNKSALNSLESVIREFLNSKDWSINVYQPQERIDCNFVINVTQWDGASAFTADIQILASRPVFGTSYNSTILNYNDKGVQFSYTEGQPLLFSEQGYISNLASLLAFYAYVIIGMDRDTFAPLGGNSELAKALDVLQYAQQGEYTTGWIADTPVPSRYWLIENLNHKMFIGIRNFSYHMHRKGLDLMISDPTKARENITDALVDVQKIDRKRPNTLINDVIFSVKAAELVEIFRNTPEKQRKEIYKILSSIDPSRGGKYESLLEVQ